MMIHVQLFCMACPNVWTTKRENKVDSDGCARLCAGEPSADQPEGDGRDFEAILFPF